MSWLQGGSGGVGINLTFPRRRTIGVRCRVTGRASTRKGIDVGEGADAGVSWVETVRQCLHDDHDLVLLLIRQPELTDRHVDVVADLGHGPAVYLFGRPCRAVSGSDVVRIH